MDLWDVSEFLEAVLREDVGSGDVTSSLAPNINIKAVVTSSSKGYISGIEEVSLLLKRHNIHVESHAKDGSGIRKGQKVLTVGGMSRDLLPIERTMLNLLSRMSGVTTATRRYADMLRRADSKAKIVATRKTTPGMMHLEKKAVELGGGLTHRMGLYDMILIKDNHLMLYGGDVRAAIEAATKVKGSLRIEVEVESVSEAVVAAEYGADLVMFDNMEPKDISRAIRLLKEKGLRKKVLLEVSGGISLDNLPAYSKLDVDWISSGKLTTSAPWLDFGLHVL